MKNKFIRIIKYSLQSGKYFLQGFLLAFVLIPLFFLSKKIISRVIFHGNLFEIARNISLFIRDVFLFMKKFLLIEMYYLEILPVIWLLMSMIFGFLIYTSDKIIKEIFVKKSNEKINIQIILKKVGLFFLKYILASLFSFSLIIGGFTLISKFNWAKKFDLLLFIPILIIFNYFINFVLSKIKKRKALNNS